jgi:hypothetical protein
MFLPKVKGNNGTEKSCGEITGFERNGCSSKKGLNDDKNRFSIRTCPP